MKYIKTFEDFVNESKVIVNEGIHLMLESRGLLDILNPDLGINYIRGGRSDKDFYKAIDKLKAAGYKEVESSDSTSHMSGKVSRSAVYDHDLSPVRVSLSLGLGYTAKENSFSYSLDKKPMTITIKNDRDYNDIIAMYQDMDELNQIMSGKDISGEIRDYVSAELRAISTYAGKKVSVSKFANLGSKLPNDKEFIEFVKERGLQILKNYLGNENYIRVNYKYDVSVSPETITNFAGINGVFNDSRVGPAYIRLDDKSDVKHLVSSLLKVPAIF